MTAGLAQQWNELEATPGTGERMRRALPDKTIPVYVTYDPDTKRRGVRAILPAGSVLRGMPRWREVDIIQEKDLDGWAVHLRLQNERFESIFASFGEDIVQSIRGVDRRRWTAVLIDRIQFWRQFFREQGFEGLSVERQRGLFAELVTLRSHVLSRLEAADAVSSWTGPKARPHDYEFTQGDVEVKAATRETPNLVHINGINQLSDGAKSLYLHVVILDSDVETGETLSGLVASIRNTIADNKKAGERFERRLKEAGYLDVHEGEYGTLIRVAGQSTYAVEGDFPRLTVAATAIRNVRYDLDLRPASSHRMDPAEAFDRACGATP